MSFLLDIIIIAIIAITIYFSAKNGFVKTAISAVSFILAVAVTAMFASGLAEKLKDTSIAETIETSTKEAITDALIAENIGIDGLLEGQSEEFDSLIGIAGIERNELKEWYQDNIASDKSGEAIIAERVAEPIVDIIAMLVAIIILFVGTQLVLSVAAYFLNKLAKLPILRTANKGLGIALGIVLSVFRVSLFCFAVNILIENAAFLNNDFINGLNPESTLLFNLFNQIDIFAFFM